ncbi:MAG: hypothetical protein JSV91_14135 [Phycisphaerales bacterium]|nr:MAG: hypothetical protein JSV91_14135 [Phycisphaerales bacterium]
MKVELADAKRIIDEVMWEAREAGGWRVTIAQLASLMLIVIVFLASGGIAFLAARIFGWYSRVFIGSIFLISLICLLIVIGTGAVYFHLMRLFVRREIRQAMARRGFELCPGCGYWLKGLGVDSPRCPECGWKREEADSADATAAT